jgi:hypothetical protein
VAQPVEKSISLDFQEVRVDGRNLRESAVLWRVLSITCGQTGGKQMAKTAGQFDKWMEKKRQRPIGICGDCGREKELRQRGGTKKVDMPKTTKPKTPKHPVPHAAKSAARR